MNVGGSVVAEQLKPAVTLTGTAKDGSGGPPIGVVDIGESERSYLCRVSLPGLKNNESNINCEIERDGKVHVYGVVTGGVLKDPWTMYEMKVQELCPSGRFSISFNLPGPVDPRLASPNFRSDGILEIVVSKPVSPRFDVFSFLYRIVAFSCKAA